MRLLYISHVPWDWTKQRPQFLAEELMNHYQVIYVQMGSFRKKTVINDKTVEIKSLFHIPFARFSLINYLNLLLYKIQLANLCRKADMIWFTSPQVLNWIPKRFFDSKFTVYDCMDDMIELFPSEKKMRINEYKLFQQAALVLSSSAHLAEKLKRRYGNRDITIVNNAISSQFDSAATPLPSDYNKYFDKDKFTLSYVGSISSWMDFELLSVIHEKYPQITINLWGPPHDVKIPVNCCINLCGTVEHKYVSSILSLSDILIMPFVVNELIESVNPVKLYEYIYSGKPCIAPLYGESLPFENFVSLYRTHDECISIIEKIVKGDLQQKSLADCKAFVKNNTWKNRVDDIYEAINIAKKN